MNVTSPLVTIGITAFNARDTIASAVETALRQNYRPIEIIAVDDCSTDDTYQILLSLAASASNMRVFRNPSNSGVATSRNRILFEARGIFVAFFDDDDESAPDRVSKQLRRLIDYEHDFAANNPVICHTARLQIFKSGRAVLASTMGELEGVEAPNGLGVASRILIGTPLKGGYGACATCSQMARLSTYRDLGGFDEQFRRSEDTEFNIRLARSGGHFVGIAEPLVRQTMTSTTEKSVEVEHRYQVMMLDKHADFVASYGLVDFCRGWLDGRLAWQNGRRGEAIMRLLALTLRNPAATMRRGVLALKQIEAREYQDRLRRDATSELKGKRLS